MAISGNTAVVGAWTDDNENGVDAGSAYVFHGLSDCNQNGTLDICDIQSGSSPDENENGTPDECEPPPLPPPPAQVMAEDSGAGGTVNVSWQANAPEDNVTGYRISFGQQSGSLDGAQLVDANVTGYQVAGLQDYTACIELAVGDAQAGAQNFIAYQASQYGSGNHDMIKAWEAYNKGVEQRAAGRLSKAIKEFRLSRAHAEHAEEG